MITWKLFSNSSHPTHNSSNQPKFPLGWIRCLHPIAWWIICHSIPSLPSDPIKDKNILASQFPIVYDQQDFPALSSATSKTDSNSESPTPCNSNISTARSFSSDDQHTPSTQTSSIITPTVDLAALKAEIKQDQKQSPWEFNAILCQEIAAMHSELQYQHSVSNHPQKSCLIPK